VPAEPLEEREAHGDVPDGARSFVWRPLQHRVLLQHVPAIVVIDSSFAKLRFFRIAEFLGGSFLLALIGIATSYVIGK
jgi:hypothetical protein